MENRLAGQVIGRFEKQGYSILASKNDPTRRPVASGTLCPCCTFAFFFPDIAAFMSSRPVMALILEGENVIQGVRDLLGPTDSTTAPSGTIRGDLGTDRMRNVVHASDGPDSALAEINRFFEADQICPVS